MSGCKLSAATPSYSPRFEHASSDTAKATAKPASLEVWRSYHFNHDATAAHVQRVDGIAAPHGHIDIGPLKEAHLRRCVRARGQQPALEPDERPAGSLHSKRAALTALEERRLVDDDATVASVRLSRRQQQPN